MKKCCNCRSDLPESNGITGNQTVQCEKCKKNELKYGKAETCQHCQLPAAFHNHVCVHCCHAERKYGPPTACVNCKLKAAFPNNHAGKNGGALCRMCLMQRKAAVLAGTNIGSSNNNAGPSLPMPLGIKLESSHKHHKHHKDAHGHKRHRNREDDIAAKQRREGLPVISSAAVDDVLAVQKLNDKIVELTGTNAKKEAVILERDKTIASLRAEIHKLERSHREKVTIMEKEKEDAVRAAVDKYRQAAKADREKAKK